MNFEELVKTRYSVRKYRTDDVPEELILKILEAARLAPTAANRQPFQLIVIRSAERRAELKRITDQHWVADAPVVVVAVAESDKAWERSDNKNFAYVDVAIVVDHITLAAANLGLGTCWVAGYDVDIARQVLGLPGSVEPVALIPIGYSAVPPGQKVRKTLKELIRYEHW